MDILPAGQSSFGVAGGARTRNLHLGKVVLYQLSYDNAPSNCVNPEPVVGIEPIIF